MDPNTKISWSRISWYYHFHCVSEANAWAWAHASSMVMWFNQQVVTDLCSLLNLVWWKTTFDGRRPLFEYGLCGWRPLMEGSLKVMGLVHLSIWGRLHSWGCLNVWCRIHFRKMTFRERRPLMDDKEIDAASKRSMLVKFRVQHWNPGEILTNFDVNNHFVASKLTELDRKNEIWRCSTWASDPDAAGCQNWCLQTLPPSIWILQQFGCCLQPLVEVNQANIYAQ